MSASAEDCTGLLEFLRCRTPAAWVERAHAGIDELLLDHAALELKAAEQAQKLIRRYGGREGAGLPPPALRGLLVRRMSRLAREELRHFERVVELIERRGGRFRLAPASRYAAGLHELIRAQEPDALVDRLLIGAVIEARSCERFLSLVETPGQLDDSIASFYGALVDSEARHFETYLALAERVGGAAAAARVAVFLERDRQLIETPDPILSFHGGPPADLRFSAGG